MVPYFCVGAGSRTGAVIRIYGPEEPEPKEIFMAPQHCLREDSKKIKNSTFKIGREKKKKKLTLLITRNVVPKKCYPTKVRVCHTVPDTYFSDKEARNANHLQIRITSMQTPDPSFHFNADPDPAPHQLMRICDHWSTDPLRFHFN
jgi:hypothetical protein